MRKPVFLCLLSLATLLVFAHEYILLAEKYRVQKGDNLELHLFVADGFNVQLERPFQKMPTKAFELLTENGSTDLSSTADGTLPIISRKVDFDGGGLIHLERGYARIALPTPKFFDYLKEDHIEGIAPKVDTAKAQQRERYTRYLKCLVQSGDGYSDTLYKRRIGQAFEIILLRNPYRLPVGKPIQAQVFFNGRPLAGKIITARNRAGNKAAVELTARTNSSGICTFPLSRAGEWFIHATHMIPCPEKADSDWESFWTSYSFALD